ncbi:MAG: hypothetical protein HPY46_04490 [Candidatus Aminicenantes bacterium]|nr:hypothetical protein [Candidatus Aminicenantes bacterium]
MFEWLFAFAHLALFLGLLSYSIWNLVRGRWLAGAVLLVFLAAYYFIVLHQAVLKEISRKKKRRKR